MAKTPFHLLLLIFVVVFLLHPSSYATNPGPGPLTFPIWKDDPTRLYSTLVRFGTPATSLRMVLDLTGRSSWFDCEATQYNSSSYRPVFCGSSQCKQAFGIACLGCLEPKPRPGCTNNTCGVFLLNPFKDFGPAEGLGTDVLVHKNNRVSGFPLSCTGTYMMDGLPRTSKGFLALTRATTSFPSVLSASLKLPRKFALCLPSIAKGHGDMYIGGGPYYRPAGGKDWSKSLLVTKLLTKHVPASSGPVQSKAEDSIEYFIDVTAIRIGYLPLSINTTLLGIDKNGIGGTKISTTASYTVLHSSIYQNLIREFTKAAISSKKIRNVPAITPFGVCFDAKTIKATRLGPDVPVIIMVLQNNVRWEINGANSMVKVNRDVYCLGFVDGGTEPTTSIVIGSHLLEDNIVEIDVGSSTFGFSNSLLMHNTSCAHVGAN